MKKVVKILISVLSIFSLLSVAFWALMYFVDGLDYVYYSQGVINAICLTCVISVFSLMLLILIIVLMFKGKHGIRIACCIFLVVFIPFSAYANFLGFAVNYFGPYGCSYTENIADYGKYDFEYSIAYFPESISEDMTVIDFSYFYKYIDTYQTDIYLEVKFSNKETMEKHLNIAKRAFSETGILEYQNPYNSKYTDIIANKWVLCSGWTNYYSSYIEFDGTEDYKYVEMDYYSITYSYDELTIIYNYTNIGGDIEIGNNADKGEYYPHFLTRFNVDWNKDNNFSYKFAEK